jgi:UDP-GlcNAc:undecaprenyl-phosphate/decaprenyl-phosphate GlcNAc-1-phosphate transferase
MDLFGNYTLLLFIFFMGTGFFSILVNKLLLKFSTNLGNRSDDDMRRWSNITKPSVGGLSIFIVFLISLASMSILDLQASTMNREMVFGAFAACTLGFVIGLADDAYNTRPLLKFLGQLLCANILITSGIYIEISSGLMLNYLFSVVWIIGIMNSINMLDNMDGVTASVALSIILSCIMLVYINEGEADAMLIVLLGVLASLLGFLFFNWHPSKIFMGDTGSQFLGVFLAVISIVYLWKFRDPSGEFFQLKQILMPLMAFIVPIIDTTTVFVRRISRGQSPFVGGRDHTTHHLAYLGFKDGQVALILLLISLFSIVIIYIVQTVADRWKFSFSLIVIAYFIIVFVMMQVLYEKGKKKLREQKKETDG